MSKTKTTLLIDADVLAFEASVVAEESIHWKDELWTLIFAAPLIAIFFPYLQPYVISGFEALNTQVPDWYLAFVAIAVSAAFGYREIVRPFMDRMTGRNR